MRRSPLEEEQASPRLSNTLNPSLPSSARLTPIQQDRLPERLKRVVVVSSVGRCCGYLDSEGVWRSDFSDEELDEVTGWQEQ